MSAGGAESLSAVARAQVETADLLVGGKRHLSYFPQFSGERLIIAADMAAVAVGLKAARDAGKRCVVLASGDPLCYGMGGTLRRWFAAEALEIWPAPTAFQMAFAALRESWQGAALLSAHARPLADVVAGVLAAEKAAILTDNRQTPAVVAQALIEGGVSQNRRCAVCENLGSDQERIVRLTLGGCTQERFAALNVLVVLEETDRPQNEAPITATTPTFLPDEAFATERNQLTKREIRMVSLAELALGTGEVMWDIGAGSGSVSIEAARARPSAKLFAVEKRPIFCGHIKENLKRFSLSNVTVVEGMAPAMCTAWPDPDCVFVGGSGGQLAEIVAVAQARLKRGGRLVINVVTFENLMTLRACLPEAQVTQIQVSRGRPIVDMMRLEAINPVFVVVWTKSDEK